MSRPYGVPELLRELDGLRRCAETASTVLEVVTVGVPRIPRLPGEPDRFTLRQKDDHILVDRDMVIALVDAAAELKKLKEPTAA